MYKCPGCGAALRFDPTSQRMKCDHCGTTLDPRDESLTHLLESQGGNAGPADDGTYTSIVYTCPNCGGTIISTEETAATFCSYCGASVVLSGRLEVQEAPDVIIPFQIDKEYCKNAYKRMLRRAPFAPNYLKKNTEIDKFRGIYMPYWIYSFAADGNTSGTGETSHRSGDYIITDYYRVNRYIESTYEGISYDAASTFLDVMSQAIAPFKAMGAGDFTPTYMSGFYADVSDVGNEVYETEASDIARAYMAEQTVRDPAYSRHGVSSSSVEATVPIETTTRRKGYFPVWFLASRTPDRKKVSYAVVNGETGKIAADLPIAFWKYIIGSLIVAVPIFFILQAFLTVTPSTALWVSIALCVVMFFVLNHQLNRTYAREHRLDDKGLLYAGSTEEKAEREKISMEEARAQAKEEARKEEKKQKNKSASAVLIILLIVIGGFLLQMFSMVRMGEEATNGLIFFSVAAGIVAFALFTIIRAIVQKHRSESTRVRVKSPMKSKVAYLIKPVIGVAISIIILVAQPVQDFYYYAAAAVSLLLVIWCAFDTVRCHNRQTLNEPPQFRKRGGDYGAK